MIIGLTLILITLCIGMAFLIGYIAGKGNIVIKKKLTDKEKKTLEESAIRQEEAIKKYNQGIENIINFNDNLE